MVTHAENERLAILETKVASIEADVSEIKTDVKQLVTAVGEIKSAATVESQRQIARERSRSDLGVWVRAAIPWIIAGGALGLGLINLLRDLI